MWKSIKINKSNIKYETEKGTLIQMPNKSAYKGWLFWHPRKLVRHMYRGKGYWFTFSYTNDFEFKIIKGRGKNKQEKKISVVELENAFKTLDDTLNSYNKRRSYLENESFYIEDEPEKVRIKRVEVDEKLLR